MLSFNTIMEMVTKEPDKGDKLLISMVKDLENTRENFFGYSYVRTMRNILIGKEDAAIAPLFKDKEYFGCFYELKLDVLEEMMDELVKKNKLDAIYTEHGKLYCSHEYHESYCKKKNRK